MKTWIGCLGLRQARVVTCVCGVSSELNDVRDKHRTEIVMNTAHETKNEVTA